MRDPVTRLLLFCGLLVPLFVVVIVVEGALRADYASLHRFGSELALGDRGWVQATNFVGTGVLVLGFAFGVRRTLAGDRGGVAAPLLAAAFGLSLMAGGIFPTDPKPGYPAGSTGTSEPTLSGTIHDANPVPFYLSLIALVVVLTWRLAKTGESRTLMWYSAATVVFVPLTFMVCAGQFDMETQSGLYHGLWQRINLGLSLGWIGVVAGYFLMARHSTTRGARGDESRPPAELTDRGGTT